MLSERRFSESLAEERNHRCALNYGENGVNIAILGDFVKLTKGVNP
ncbi:unnamed protein product [Brassica oleracea]